MENNDELEQILISCLCALGCQRESFYPDKNYGSYLSLIKNKTDLHSALSYARQALADIDGVYVKSVRTADNNYIFDILINDIKRQVTIAV